MEKTDSYAKELKSLYERAAATADSAAASAERASGLKSTLWITSLTTVIAVIGIVLAAYFGTQQSNQSIVQTTLSAYQQGRSDNPATLATTPGSAVLPKVDAPK